MKLFDICIITTSSERRADSFRRMIRNRYAHGVYPREIAFRVYADPPSGRIGSGGSTLITLSRLYRDCGKNDPFAFFSERKILIIHAGGQSRRLPYYAPEGKIFTPLPVSSSSLYPPILLDLALNLFLKYPWRKGEVLIGSGDVIVDFDVDLIPDERGDICGFAKESSVTQGSKHGVFVLSSDNFTVIDYLQKARPAILRERALIKGSSGCALDMGLIALSPKLVTALLEFSEERFDGSMSVLDAIEKSMLSLSLYLEILSACVKGYGFEEYCAGVVSQSAVDKRILALLFKNLNRFSLRALVPPSPTFMHTGSMKDFLESCELLSAGEMKPFYEQGDGEAGLMVARARPSIQYNSIGVDAAPASRNGPVIFENVRNCTVKKPGGMNIFLGLRDCVIEENIPAGICIDERTIEGSPVRMIYSLSDTFKPARRTGDITFCGVPLDRWLDERGLDEGVIWEQGVHDLLRARLFSGTFSMQFLEGFWKIPDRAGKKGWAETFKKARRYSIGEINELTEVEQRESERIASRKELLRGAFDEARGWSGISVNDFKAAFDNPRFHPNLMRFYRETGNPVLREYRRALLRSLVNVEDEEGASFDIELGKAPAELKIGVKEDQIVWARSPVRIDLAGGWSDTPPHTFRIGGRVVNVAADLNGQPPIQVFCRRTDDYYVKMYSIDLGIDEVMTSLSQLEDYRNPGSPFALSKAALCLIGLNGGHLPGRNLADVLGGIGCGIEITILCAVPKGSGLGTSSILGATLLAALHRFFAVPYTKQDLFLQTLMLEQMLTTGGGWQDQIGGVEGGIKYIESMMGIRMAAPDTPGAGLNFTIEKLDPAIFIDHGTLGCVTLYYTGITRLAKSILQDVVKQANENTPAYMFTLHHIKKLAAEAREAILKHDIELLGDVILESWEANKRIHPSATNAEIDALLSETKAYYRGVKLLGAGGGGYALFISSDRAKAEKLKQVLSRRASNSKARLLDLSLNDEGLWVSVS
jgi:galactokinase/mevalonate kinase-like predicted kinase